MRCRAGSESSWCPSCASIARYVRERFQLSLAAIVVANEAGEEWEHRAIALRPGRLMPARKRWPVSSGVVGRAIRMGEPQLVFDVASDPDYFGLDASIVCEYAIPLRFQGRILGAFNLEGADRSVFEAENLALFRTLAEQIVGRIELALVNQKLKSVNQELAALARRDALTGVANRRQFDEALETEWRRGDTVSTLVHETDLALYRAKSSGRNLVARADTP